jgi:3-oxoacyl-[acyl-carrier-protein] synthase-3
MVDTSDEWILTRTGIRERHIAADDEPTSALATKAAERALEAAGLDAAELDLIVVATLTGDHVFPNTACYVQKRLNAHGSACFGLEAACSGFLYGLEIISSLIRTGVHQNALLIGAEKLSFLTDWTDRATCVLFGDGAGAAVLQRTTPDKDAFLASKLGADGEYTDLLYAPAGGSAMPITHERLDQGLHYIKMQGREVFKLAVNGMVSAATDVLAEAGLTGHDLRWLIPHQANTRIIQAVGERLEVPQDKVFINLDRYGNTSAATIPIALDEIVRGGLVEHGDAVLMVAFGGGLTWGASLIRW